MGRLNIASSEWWSEPGFFTSALQNQMTKNYTMAWQTKVTCNCMCEPILSPPVPTWKPILHLLRRISSARTKLLAARCECLHLIKISCLSLWLDESAHASLAASCEELRARTGNPPLDLVQVSVPQNLSRTVVVIRKTGHIKRFRNTCGIGFKL
jgi:hypothetical protein